MSIWTRAACALTTGLLAVLGVSGPAIASYPWTVKAPMPTDRTLHSLCEVDGKLYAIAGSRTVYASTGIVEMYDAATDTWSKKADLPVPTCGQAASVWNGRIYVFGGLGSVYGAVTPAAWEYDPPGRHLDQEGRHADATRLPLRGRRG